MILIKPMQPKHLDAVHSIERASFVTPWSKESLLREITENECAVYVVAMLFEAFRQPEVVGYAGMWHVTDEGHITNIAVMERYRKKGIAATLLTRLTELAVQRNISALTLEVRVGNTTAQNLYTKHGFAVEGRRKGYYADTGEDAYIMWKSLEPA